MNGSEKKMAQDSKVSFTADEETARRVMVVDLKDEKKGELLSVYF